MKLEPIFGKPSVVEKKWGRELIIDNNDKYCGKFLHFDKNSKISNHFHVKKSETWYVLEGEIEFQYFDYEAGEKKVKTMVHGDTVFIPAGVLHRGETKTGCLIVEVSSQHFDNDSYRIQPSGKSE